MAGHGVERDRHRLGHPPRHRRGAPDDSAAICRAALAGRRVRPCGPPMPVQTHHEIRGDGRTARTDAILGAAPGPERPGGRATAPSCGSEAATPAAGVALAAARRDVSTWDHGRACWTIVEGCEATDVRGLKWSLVGSRDDTRPCQLTRVRRLRGRARWRASVGRAGGRRPWRRCASLSSPAWTPLRWPTPCAAARAGPTGAKG